MHIELISFGKISEIIGNRSLEVTGVTSTDELIGFLEKIFPELAGVKYKLALNKTLVQSNIDIKEQDIIAIMPPFSGG